MQEVLSSTDRPIFYSLAERRNLVELLTAGAQRSKSRKDRYFDLHHPGDRAEEQKEALRQRRVFELDCAARNSFATFLEGRNGRLNQRIALVRALPHLVADLEARMLQLGPVFERYGPGLTKRLLDQIHIAAQFYEKCHKRTSKGVESIASEGDDSRTLANACLNEFLTIVCITWVQGTAEKVRVGSGTSPFQRFAVAAIEPFVDRINADKNLISADWKRLAQRIVRLKLRDHDLLTPNFEKQAIIRRKPLQRVISTRPASKRRRTDN
jgi:hypothetical protein